MAKAATPQATDAGRIAADAILLSLTDAQLETGLKKGRAQLAMIDSLEQTEPLPMAGEGPFPASKAYENWSAADYARRRKMLESAINDVTREQERRAALAATKKGEAP